jgi:hypothetical protein
MITKDCILNSKYRLQTVLNHKCLVEEYSDKLDNCKGCTFNKEAQKEKKDTMTAEEYKSTMEMMMKLIGFNYPLGK